MDFDQNSIYSKLFKRFNVDFNAEELNSYIDSISQNSETFLDNIDITNENLNLDYITNINQEILQNSVSTKTKVSNIKNDLSYLGKRVVNISKLKLGRAHVSVLEKGITFCPTPFGINLAEVHQDISDFIRRLQLKVHFFDDENPEPNVIPSDIPPGLLKFKKKSRWCPKPQDHCLNAFIEKVNNDLSTFDPHVVVDNNLSLEEKKALKELRECNSIVIKKADKSSSIVVMNKDDYIEEAERQLSDAKFYKKLSSDPTKVFNNEINLLLEKLKNQGEINDELLAYLVQDKPKTASLYLLPKTHKIKKENVFPPGRPIISANNCPTEKISAFVDENIKGSIPNIKSYIKDTSDFICKVESLKIPENCILVTLDVTSLYTNIPNREGIEAVSRFLRKYKPLYTNARTVTTLLHEVLTKNTFEFNGTNYLQIGGTAMGTKLAPSYANIFMGDLETKTLESYENKPLLWVRFIDDIFCIWTHGEEELKKFHEHLNSFHESIKYTLEYSFEKVVFLDTWVKKLKDILIVELYTKPTDTHNYLHFTSSHPKHTKRAGPYGQFLRIRRNCTLQSDYIKHSLNMKKHYLLRGYPEQLIEDSRRQALLRNRKELLIPKSKKQRNENVVPFILTHHPTNYLVRKIISDNWGVLSHSDLCQKALPKTPLYGTRRSKNLKDILIKSKLNNEQVPKPTGTRIIPDKCKKPFCLVCKKLKSNSAKCTVTGNSHTISTNIDCHTKNVVYCLTCNVCQKQYIGETKRNFISRYKEHLSGIKYKRNYPVTNHCLTHPSFNIDHDLIPRILEVITRNPDLKGTDDFRKKRELHWIYKFRCLNPKGLNVMGQ